ncbi:MAG: AAA family ATPase [Vicinamibacterales bacterium]
MARTIVAISRQFASGGARVGRAVAQRLGFQYADRAILAEAARELRVGADDLAPLEEHTAGFWDRIGTLFAHGSPDAPFVPPPLPSVTEADLFAVERQIIDRIAARGRAVIVGRGAAHVIPRSDAVLRVFLHAPLEHRTRHAMDEYGFTDPEAALAVLRDSDRARAKFVRHLTGRDWCDATLYDLCLDTAALGVDPAADLIVHLVEPPPVSPPPARATPDGLA